MPDWEQTEEDEAVIAHISDLHVGSRNYSACWNNLQDFLNNTVQPSLVLVTGDIADTPSRELYQSAKADLDALGVDYCICAGNHDRHMYGNVFSRFIERFVGNEAAHFDQVFGARIARPEAVQVVQSGAHPLRIGVLGVDSSLHADFYARGHVEGRALDSIEQALDPQLGSLDLVILLVHHHLQSVRALEEARQGNLKDLANVMCMVNSGCTLERLTRLHIDLALHGHEHVHHWARYGSLEGPCGDILVLGAGSATGNDALQGCSPDRASFNAILVSSNGSARFRKVVHTEGTWKVADQFLLFDAKNARRRRLLRQSEHARRELSSAITKHTEFTAAGDILVNWVFTNWHLPSNEFTWKVENSTGTPVDPILVFTRSNGETQKPTASFERDLNQNYVWRIRAVLPRSFNRLPMRIEWSYGWRAGALLTKEQMDPVAQGAAPGPLRAENLEFASIRTFSPIASAQLLLTIPPEYAPPEGVAIGVYDETPVRHPAEEGELRDLLLNLGRGKYSLTIPFPRDTWSYALAWRPVPAPLGAAASGG